MRFLKFMTVNNAKTHYENKILDQSFDNLKRFLNHTRHHAKSSSSIGALESEGKKFTQGIDVAER